MTKPDDDFEVVHGSGNVFPNFGCLDADAPQIEALLAARIIGILDDEGLSTRKAQEMTGIAHADFARIRNAKLARISRRLTGPAHDRPST
jgi:hypothetical protein